MAYAEVMTRQRWDGAIDKLALLQHLASKQVQDKDFCDKVLAVVASAGNSAAAQASAWCTYVEGLRYRRDPLMVEVFRDPLVVMAEGGGDCDDLTLLCLAGLYSLAIPCMPEALCDEEGWAFHVRVLVGLPPLRPETWTVVDPVWSSERQWAMADLPPSSLPLGRDGLPMQGPSSTSSSTTRAAVGAAVLAAGLLMSRGGLAGLLRLVK